MNLNPDTGPQRPANGVTAEHALQSEISPNPLHAGLGSPGSAT